jgi:nitroimidazol reductase NimA-like FMN-containing flavoprotein (pyridoxamine 5'-phosphate oxidase superfamily)
MSPSDRADDRGVAVPPDEPLPTAPAPGPRIRALDLEECRRVLDRNVVGRLAFAFQRRVEILPIHYVHDDGWLYGRTAPGDKLRTWEHSRWVAFEVDEVRALFDWTSVVVHGGLYLISADAPHEAALRERAVAVLRRLVPEAGSPHDPVAFRSQLFRIHVDAMSGREALPPPAPS